MEIREAMIGCPWKLATAKSAWEDHADILMFQSGFLIQRLDGSRQKETGSWEGT